MTVLVIVLVIIFAILLFGGTPERPEDDASLSYQRLHGDYKVRYPDGNYSQPFLRKTAYDYASMFGGKVIKFR